MKYIRYQAAGNSVGIEEWADDYWEIADDGFVVRAVNIQLDGANLKYDENRAADRLGALPEGKILEQMLGDRSLGKFTLISLEEFELIWSMKARNEA